MEKGEASSKKARVAGPGRQDTEGAANVAGAIEAAAPREELTVQLDKANLHSPRYNHPFNPPIFQFLCEAGHLACNKCYAELPKGKCYKCDHDGAYTRNITLEKVVAWVRIPCPYNMYGCKVPVVYNDVSDHQRGCPFAPCGCPERGCPFVGSPSMLRQHIPAKHSRFGPILAAPYGLEWKLTMELATPWLRRQRRHFDVDGV